MPIKIDFKYKYPLSARRIESSNIKDKHPDRIPVIITKNPSSQIDNISKIKYLFPIEFTIPQLLCVIRQKISLKPAEAINIFIQTPDEKEVIPSYSASMSSLYIDYVESFKTNSNYDGYLYIIYSSENTFG
jgi:GABA(A) receptor-associated protein